MRDPANNNAVRINNSNNHNFVWTNSNSNSNSNENNVGRVRPRVINPNNLRRMRTARLRFVLGGGRRLNFVNNNRPNTSNYMKNEKRMKTNANENTKTKKITWKRMSVKNFPRDPISTNNIESGEKVVKINKLYLTPNSFRKLARMSMTSALNANGNMVLFKNPMTRGTVKKGDLEFVVINHIKKK
jgi:hypothetical protein